MFEMRFRNFVLGPLASFVIAAIALALYLDVEHKQEVSDDFHDLSFKIWFEMPENSSQKVWIKQSCLLVRKFVMENPGEVDIDVDCNQITTVDSLNFDKMNSDFNGRIAAIAQAYDDRVDKTKFLAFIMPIVLQISAWFALQLLNRMDDETGDRLK